MFYRLERCENRFNFYDTYSAFVLLITYDLELIALYVDTSSLYFYDNFYETHIK